MAPALSVEGQFTATRLLHNAHQIIGARSPEAWQAWSGCACSYERRHNGGCAIGCQLVPWYVATFNGNIASILVNANNSQESRYAAFAEALSIPPILWGNNNFHHFIQSLQHIHDKARDQKECLVNMERLAKEWGLPPPAPAE